MSSHQRISRQQRNSRSRDRLPAELPAFDENLIRDALEKPDVQALTPSVVMQLQRTIGNRAAAQLVKGDTKGASVIQRNPIKIRLYQFIKNSEKGDKINTLARHLLLIMNAMDNQDYGTAYDLLYNRNVLEQLGYGLEISLELINTNKISQENIPKKVDTIAKQAMHHKGIKLYLPDVCVGTSTNDLKLRTAFNDANIAWQVLPIFLEEWIHMFQYTTQGFLSQGTEQFRQTEEVQENQMLPEGSERWNLNEVDIYAIYKDLGWNQVLDAFRARYTERQVYDEFEFKPFVRANPSHNVWSGLSMGSHRENT